MKIIIVLLSDVLHFPPIVSLVHILNNMQVSTLLITTETNFDVSEMEYVQLVSLNVDYEHISSPAKKLMMIPALRNRLWKIIDDSYGEDTTIWCVSNLTLKYLGEKIAEYRYVLHFLELSEDLRYYEKIPFFKLNAHYLAEQAKAVVVPEYNRAHILQAWWNLSRVPEIFSNKPYINKSMSRNTPVSDSKAREILNAIGDRKIILYQGIISPERPLDKFVKAVESMGNEYAFVVMSGGEDIYKKLDSTNYYFIPFVKPPYHLEITSHAYIGVLAYYPTRTTGYSVLNSIYCAPNKTFEYGMFGIPMIGNNIPGLKYVFETSDCGVCMDGFSVDSICNAIYKIETHYTNYSMGAMNYYNKTDSRREVEEILSRINK